MKRIVKDALSVTTNSKGENALKITKTNDDNLYVNFPSSDFMKCPSTPFSLLIDNVEFDVQSGSIPIKTLDTVFEDTGRVGKANLNWDYDNIVRKTTSVKSRLSFDNTTKTSAHYINQKTLINTTVNRIEFNYYYNASVDDTKIGFNIGGVDYKFDDIVNKDAKITIDLYYDSFMVIYIDDVFETFKNVSLPANYGFKFFINNSAQFIEYSHFHIYYNNRDFYEHGIGEYNDDYEIIENDSIGLDYISKINHADCVEWNSMIIGGRIYPCVEGKYSWLGNSFEANLNIISHNEECGFVISSKKFNKLRYFSFSSLGIPSGGARVKVTYDGFKIRFYINGVEKTNVADSSFQLENNIAFGFYMGLMPSSFKYNNLTIGSLSSSFKDAGYNSDNNPRYYTNDTTSMKVGDNFTTVTSTSSNKYALFYPAKQRAEKPPIMLQGQSILIFDYIHDGGDGSDKCIEIMNYTETRKSSIYIKDFFSDLTSISDAKLKIELSDNVATYYRYNTTTSSWKQIGTVTMYFNINYGGYFRFRQNRGNGKFTFKNLTLQNNVYGYNFTIIARGFDKRGKIHCNREYEVGIWEKIVPVTVSTKDKMVNIVFSDVPSEVQFVDFLLKFTENIPSIILSDFMLYKGDKYIEHQNDTSKDNLESTVVEFNRNIYANLYDEADNNGLSIIRPYQDSFNLQYIKGSETTVLYPYMQKHRDEDDPSRVALEYLKGNNQDINVDWG